MALDDSTTGGDTYTVDDTYSSNPKNYNTNPILKQIFLSCEDDARGSVHRAWAASVLCMILFFIFACVEGELR